MGNFGQIRTDQLKGQAQKKQRARSLPILKKCCRCFSPVGYYSIIQYADRKQVKRLCYQCAGLPLPLNPKAC